MKLYGNAVVGQSGGPTAAINATLAGVILGAMNAHGIIDTVYGMKNGVEGLLQENLVDLNREFANPADIEKLIHTPAAALGSCRKKLPNPDTDTETFEKLFDIFKKYNIRYFFYIGGNDSMDTVAKLSAYSEKKEYDMRIIGVPKTIDNDLVITDHTPGFGSAAKYIATTLSEFVRDCAVYTVKAVTIVEIMGRDAGWLTTAAALASQNGEGIDLIYLPEKIFSLEKFIEDVKKRLEVHPNVVVAVSEGIRYADGRYVGEGTQSGVADVFGHKYLAGTAKALEIEVKNALGCKVRSVELSLCQRCASHIASKTDLDESVLVGQYAVKSAIDGISGHMMTMLRDDDGGYKINVSSSPVADIANKVKTVPDDYINADENGVTEKCISYLLPLIKGEAYPEYENGVPVQYVIK